MKSRILVILTIVTVMVVAVATARQVCPGQQMGCQISCKQEGACKLGKGCDIKDKDKQSSKDKDKAKECDKDKDKDKDKDHDPNCAKDPNSKS